MGRHPTRGRMAKNCTCRPTSLAFQRCPWRPGRRGARDHDKLELCKRGAGPVCEKEKASLRARCKIRRRALEGADSDEAGRHLRTLVAHHQARYQNAKETGENLEAVEGEEMNFEDNDDDDDGTEDWEAEEEGTSHGETEGGDATTGSELLNEEEDRWTETDVQFRIYVLMPNAFKTPTQLPSSGERSSSVSCIPACI
ncbi:uncharacterized protein EV422DRAFT_114390 [Fimicolochytrium jonesii]|uniref:uncharacterized protein n=1 Tax=Fimicolochytrium jonesii TaxID=1396493 RepID=UPI0022FE0072|nr:uncharacterized protein EV422DRAFT_114390 [Fimicolochytrium jonesii]KAI8819482.1 hypothetical protein EV422DRAFT_114390 [Fimicolochytrium jonesii]